MLDHFQLLFLLLAMTVLSLRRMKVNVSLGAVTAAVITTFSFVDCAAAMTFANGSYNDGTATFTTLIGADREWFQISDTEGLSVNAALSAGTRVTDGFRVANLTDMNALLDFFGISTPGTLSASAPGRVFDSVEPNNALFSQFGLAGTGRGRSTSGLYFDGAAVDVAQRLFGDRVLYADSNRSLDYMQSNAGVFLVRDAAAIPTPALLPGLLSFGAAAWRKRRLANSGDA